MKAGSSFVFVLAFSLVGCASTGGHDVTMRVQDGSGAGTVLIGTFNGSIALIHGSPKDATISLSDGLTTCLGQSTSGQFSTDMQKNQVRHAFRITCNDGRSGNLVANITARPQGFGTDLNGVGVGSLNDGSQLRAVFGEVTGSLVW